MSAQIPMKCVAPAVESFPEIPDCKVIRPKLFPDDRGFFSETYNCVEWKEKLNFTVEFKQDNHSFSHQNVIRGMHAQPGMGKLVQVISGEIYDVAVDARPGSDTYGKYVGITLNEKEKKCFWVPDGFLHGFVVLSPQGAHVTYKCSAVYDPTGEFGVNPFDPQLNIKWPIDIAQAIVSERDRNGLTFESVSSRH